MNAFVTGSRAYGTPRPDSDIDLVVIGSRETFDQLAKVADEEKYRTELYPRLSKGNGSASLRFGKLNLLFCVDQAAYDDWKNGTEFLKDEARWAGEPRTRDRAKEVFKALRDKTRAKLAPWSEN